ncbi:hypothetical protein [uncultured Nostoc sp.]|uniref:hypothetical protein n=1 Tax=uncultured Nostoc sp. TaxID=340711 RepID=UPI0035CAAC97
MKLEKTWLAIAPIKLQFGTVSSNVKCYPDGQILTATATGEGMSGFALEIGDSEAVASHLPRGDAKSERASGEMGN